MLAVCVFTFVNQRNTSIVTFSTTDSDYCPVGPRNVNEDSSAFQFTNSTLPPKKKHGRGFPVYFISLPSGKMKFYKLRLMPECCSEKMSVCLCLI